MRHIFEPSNGLYYFDSPLVTGESYKQLLTNYFLPVLPSLPPDAIFQKDGTPSHYSLEVRQLLNEKLLDSKIGRKDPIRWPASSQDLTPLDNFYVDKSKTRSLRLLVSILRNLREESPLQLEAFLYKYLRKYVKTAKLDSVLLLEKMAVILNTFNNYYKIYETRSRMPKSAAKKPF